METAKIRIKIGDHEFEAEGPAETVQEQFAMFKDLISSAAAISPKEAPQSVGNDPVFIDAQAGVARVSLEKIVRVSGRVVSLTAIPASTQDAALLIMLGHKDLKDSDSVTGQEIGDGLAQSGRPVDRTDRIMKDPLASAFVLKSGIKRSTRYRLTNQGHQKALAVARELIATLP